MLKTKGFIEPKGSKRDFEGLILRVVYYTVQQKHSVLYHP